MTHTLSILIPLFNNSHDLLKSLQSIRSSLESCSNIGEIQVVIKEGSSSIENIRLTKQYLAMFANTLSIRYYQSPDSGVYDAMNTMLNLAQGQWYLFLGAGDLLKENYFDIVLPTLCSATAKYILYNVDLLRRGKIYNNNPSTLNIALKNFCHQGILYHKSVFHPGNSAALDQHYDLQYPVKSDYAFHICNYNQILRLSTYIPESILVYDDTSGLSKSLNDWRFELHKPFLVMRFVSIRKSIVALAFFLLMIPSRLKRLTLPTIL